MWQGCYYQYHSTADEWVPFSLGEKLWAAAENVDASCSTFSTEDLVGASSQALLAMLLPGCNESCTRPEFSLLTGGQVLHDDPLSDAQKSSLRAFVAQVRVRGV